MNTGRERIIGSFKPIDDKEWAEPAYVGAMEEFCNAITRGDRRAASDAIAAGVEINRRDPVGRTALQIAILSRSTDVACDLIDAGARITTTVVDGRNALHFAAQMDLPAVARKLLERSKANAEAAEVEKDKSKSVGNDELQVTLPDYSTKASDADVRHELGDGIITDDNCEDPDILEIDGVDWDHSMSALDYAVASGSASVVDVLLAAGANPKLVTQPKYNPGIQYVHPLILTATTEDEEKGSRIAEMLITAGAVTSDADDELCTILHRAVNAGCPSLVDTLLKCDPTSKSALNVPWFNEYGNSAVFPIVTAVQRGSYSLIAVLLAHGASLVITKDEFQRGRDMR